MSITRPKLTIWLSTSEGLSLQKTQFNCHQLATELTAIRGNSQDKPTTSGTFRWSPAVHALCLLLLKTAQLKFDGAIVGDDEAYGVSGGSGSLAASLDYAITKQPLWLSHMFGFDEYNSPFSRHLISRINSERKRGGDVVLFINRNILSPNDIDIFLDGREVNTAEELNEITVKITGAKQEIAEINSPDRELDFLKAISIEPDSNSPRQTAPSDPYPSPFNKEIHRNALEYIVKKEIFETLYRTDIFNRSVLIQSLKKIYKNPSFRNLVGRKELQLVNDLDLNLCSTQRLGIPHSEKLMREKLCGEQPIRCAVAPGRVGSLAILQYLRQIKGYNIECDFRESHSIGIIHSLVHKTYETPPDICILSLPAAGGILSLDKSIGYHPLMFMPKISFRLTVPKHLDRTTTNLHFGDYVFLADDYSSSSFYFHDLSRYGIIDRKKTSVINLEPDETFSLLSSGNPDLRAILWFPHYHFNEVYNRCTCVDPINDEIGYREAVLFLHESLLNDIVKVQCLDIAIRDAWLELKQNGYAIDTAAKLLIHDSTFLRLISRSSGLHGMSPDVPSPANLNSVEPHLAAVA